MTDFSNLTISRRAVQAEKVNRETYPAMFDAMDSAAAEFWAYPSPEWQDEFIEAWLEKHQ